METTKVITKDLLLKMKIGEERKYLLENNDYIRVRSIGLRLYEKGYNFIMHKPKNTNEMHIKRLE